jgi:hypothetical protein
MPPFDRFEDRKQPPAEKGVNDNFVADFMSRGEIAPRTPAKPEQQYLVFESMLKLGLF